MRRPTLRVLLLCAVFVVGLVVLPGDGEPEPDPGAGPDEPAAAPEDDESRAAPAAEAESSGAGGDAPAPSEGPTARSQAQAATPDPEPPEPPEGSEELVARLEELLADVDLDADDAEFGVSVVAGNGAPLLEERADEPLLPASTQKLVTAAAALHALGPDFEYVTTVEATAEVGGDGILDGDLILVGSGDPTLVTPTYATYIYPARPGTALDDLAEQIADAGVTHVAGRVRGDPTVFTDHPTPSGWLDRYFHTLDATNVAGLTVDGGRRIFERDDQLLATVAEDPALTAATALDELLEERDIVVEGNPRSTLNPPDTVTTLGSVSSAPLSELLRFMVQQSDNHLADSVYRKIGQEVVGIGSWTGAAAGSLQILDELGVDWSGAVLADGSGLSRDDRLAAATLTALDVAMTDSPHGATWENLMAVAGDSGTLEGRLVGTVAEQRLRGKTGTLNDVRSLSGAVVGPDGERHHFAVIGNGLQGQDIQTLRRFTDDVVLALAEDLYDCVRDPLPTDDEDADEDAAAEEAEEEAEDGPYELVCAAA